MLCWIVILSKRFLRREESGRAAREETRAFGLHPYGLKWTSIVSVVS